MKTGIQIVDWWDEGFSPEIHFLFWGGLIGAWYFHDGLLLFVTTFIEELWWMPFGLWAILAGGIFVWRQIRS